MCSVVCHLDVVVDYKYIVYVWRCSVGVALLYLFSLLCFKLLLFWFVLCVYLFGCVSFVFVCAFGVALC